MLQYYDCWDDKRTLERPHASTRLPDGGRFRWPDGSDRRPTQSRHADPVVYDAHACLGTACSIYVRGR
ncbi:hypothetical protein ELS17_00875 [Natrinema altunense]|uniref:Uncharacterized protein n=1 Tax=Natrinema altunense TaxID=222984 RepID=A0A482Y173_9EURY|nr:hypothetical protein ELS17_00875 [Natrinema altunense]